jgi:hypothetical protein
MSNENDLPASRSELIDPADVTRLRVGVLQRVMHLAASLVLDEDLGNALDEIAAEGGGATSTPSASNNSFDP